ncbi:cell division protein FtsA [Bacillus tianshenii]|nr:cell division protein FtsA [Bacillus tianshenii]
MNSNEIYVSLDIGTSNVKVIIGEVSNDSLNIIGVGNVQSEGLRKGSIVDIDETVHSIRKAVEQAERMVGLDIKRVIVGVSGNQIELMHCHGVVAVQSENKEIRNEDVARVIDAAQVVSIPPEREIISVVPHQFIVDGVGEINDPRGIIGVRLEVEGTIITTSKNVLHNLLRCVERAGLEIIDISLQPLAAGHFALSKDEKYMGAALIDIGGGTTTISVFEQGQMQAVTTLPFGGTNMTKDISIGLRTTAEEAEKVKVKYGYAYFDMASEDETFSVPVIGSDTKETYNQLELSDIIEARLEEMFEMIQETLRKMGYRELPGGYALTGGVANMTGVVELAREVLQPNVRIAHPDYIGVREPQYTTGVGLIRYIHHKAKLQGIEVDGSVSEAEEEYAATSEPQSPKKSKAKKANKENMKDKMKQWIGYFFE